MRDNLEELKSMLRSYDRKNTVKIVLIVLVSVLAVAGIIGAVVCFMRGCGCDCFDDDFCDCEDDFDDDEEE